MNNRKHTTANTALCPKLEGWSANLISAYPKVLQILNGEIPIPEVVEIFPTNYCNFNCPHCRFENYHGDSTTYIDLNLFDTLLKELKKYNIQAIEFSGGGESLVHPQIEEIFKKLINGGFRVGLITNGYQFTNSDKLIKLANECCNWIRFSLDAFSEKTFQKVHGTNSSYFKLKKTITKMASKKTKLPDISIKMLISKINVDECNLAIKEALQMKVTEIQFKFLGNHPLALNEKEMSLVKSQIVNLIQKNKIKKLRIELLTAYQGKTDKTSKCLMTFLHPVIDWDGEIYMCAFFEHRKKNHAIGNIKNGGFMNHWLANYHKKAFDSINPNSCIPNCPMKRYNPVVDFIKNEYYRFPFI
ncbi:radical SAM protein [Patescibacteria group bacterium]|nr:radical SAM protein [Patescibacteria group bacterium]